MWVYSFEVKYKVGSNKPGDYLSCSNLVLPPKSTKNIAKEYIHFITLQALPNALTFSEIEDATSDDKDMLQLKNGIQNGNFSLSGPYSRYSTSIQNFSIYNLVLH